jgi:hypothetical protein
MANILRFGQAFTGNYTMVPSIAVADYVSSCCMTWFLTSSRFHGFFFLSITSIASGPYFASLCFSAQKGTPKNGTALVGCLLHCYN